MAHAASPGTGKSKAIPGSAHAAKEAVERGQNSGHSTRRERGMPTYLTGVRGRDPDAFALSCARQHAMEGVMFSRLTNRHAKPASTEKLLSARSAGQGHTPHAPAH